MFEEPSISSDYIAKGSDMRELFFLLEKAPFAMSVLKDRSLIIDMANEKLLEIWGKKKEEVIGEPLFKCFPELIGTQSEKIFKYAFETGEKFVSREYETSFLRNGELYSAYFDLNIDPIIHINGSVTGLLITSTDVTEQVLARKKAEESQKQLEYFIKQAPVGIVVYKGRDFIVETANEMALEMWGKTLHEVKGRAMAEIFPEINAKENIKALHEASIEKFAKGESFIVKEAELTFNRKGEVYTGWYNYTHEPIRDADGKVTGIIAVANEVTDQVLARKKIEESEQQLHLITDAIPSLISYIDKNERYQFNNKGYEQWFGYTAEDIKEKTVREIIGEEAYKNIEPFIKRVLAGENVSFEAWAPYKDGGKRFISATYIPHRNDENSVIGFYALVNDITQRKKIEQALVESEEQNRLFIKYSPAAMAMFDKEMRYVSVSNQWLKEYDLEGDIIGKKHYDLFPNILDRWKEVHSRCMKGAMEKADEDFYVKDDGTPVWLKWEVHPWYNLTGEIGGIVIFTENITERKKAQQLIKESEERFRMLATEAPLFVWLTNEKLQTTYLNKAGLDYFDLDETIELSVLSWKKFIHPDDLPTVLETMYEAAEKHEPYTLEMRLKNGKTGEYHWFLDNGTPKYIGEEFKGFIGTSLDIHQKKEAEVLKYEKQKLELQKALESDKLKSDFIKMASHELKTPVTSIKGFVQLLLSMINEMGEKELSPLMVKSSLVSIERQVNRLTRLMSELLDLSKLETGQFELHLEEHSLNELMIDIVQDVIYTNPKQHINLYHEFECTISCDKDRLSQAVMNLLMNAIKYSPQADKVDVTISKHSEKKAAISIQDYGIGIDKKDHEKIFDRFYRVQGKTELTYQGFGIGLYIAKEIIHMHEGDIEVKSEKGHGATFTFTIPLRLKDKP